jgi:hypothetical protein
MFETFFASAGRRTRVLLPFPIDAVLDDWSSLRTTMIRSKPEAFTRTEWAYLVEFLDREALAEVFREAFGSPDPAGGASAHAVARPGGMVAVWLPNNVSLLGALSLILLSLTGNPIRLKSGSRGDDPTRTFLDYTLERLRPGPLHEHLLKAVAVETFTREDPRNAEWASLAHVRIAFGSDAGVAAIESLAHPDGSAGFSFGHRVSQAWIEPAACDDRDLETVLRVFDVYGQAACTSPSRVVLLDATRDDARLLRDRMVSLWSRVFPRPPEAIVASTGLLEDQWARVEGWDSRLVCGHGAALAVGDPGMSPPAGQRILPLMPMTISEALERLPRNIQTVGHAVSPAVERDLLPRLTSHGVLRVVPVREMHHFGPVWDGQDYWRRTFSVEDVA